MNQVVINVGKKIVPHDIRVSSRKLNWKRYYLQSILLKQCPEDKVFCPIAKKEFKTFIRIHNDLVTPSNGARSRLRLVWHYLENDLKIFDSQKTLLHTAPELSFLEAFRKNKSLNYIPGDKMVSGYSNQKGIQNIDLTDLKYEDCSFDYVLSNHVLEHIPDDIKAMSEIYRVLKDGGTGVITVPINEKLDKTFEDPAIVTAKDRAKHYGQWDHLRWYALDIKERFEEVGFKVEVNRYGKKFSSEDYNRFGFSDDVIFILRKN